MYIGLHINMCILMHLVKRKSNIFSPLNLNKKASESKKKYI